MHKLSEVCKMIGVSRRTLQEYNRIGLLKPTHITEGGYWLYDKAAIEKLVVINIFVEAGYERKSIKAILESPKFDMQAELNHLLEVLEDKRKRIGGMINTVKILKHVFSLPESTLSALGSLDMIRFYDNKSFSTRLDESILHSAEIDEEDYRDVEPYITIMYSVFTIGFFIGTPADSVQVQSAVEGAYKCMLNLVQADISTANLTSSELAQDFYDGIKYLLSDPETCQAIDQQCGDGAAEYIQSAVHIFCKQLSQSE